MASIISTLSVTLFFSLILFARPAYSADKPDLPPSPSPQPPSDEISPPPATPSPSPAIPNSPPAPPPVDLAPGPHSQAPSPGENDARQKKTLSPSPAIKRSKTKRCDEAAEKDEEFVDEIENIERHNKIEDFARMITRSRSISVGTTAMTSGLRRSKVNSSPAKGKSWHFPSPVTVFRSSKTPKAIVQNRSPLHIG